MNETSTRVVIDANKDPNWPETLKTHLQQQLGDMEAADRRGHNKPPVKNTPEDEAVANRAYGIAAGELRQFIEQFEQLDAEKADIAEQQKELMAEARARGYETKAMRKLIAERKRDKNDLAEENAILDMYRAALGMA